MGSHGNLKKIAVNAMALNEGEGTNFYEFANISDEKAFKTLIRAAADLNSSRRKPGKAKPLGAQPHLRHRFFP